MRVGFRLTLVAALLGLASPSLAATSANGLPISDAVLQRQWTGAWIACPGAPERDPGVYRFRKVIELPAVPPRFVVHVSADQRFVLRVNGRRVGIGPSRGDILFWRFQTFDLAPFLKPGRNLLSAVVWNFGTQAPAAQITDRTGFVVQGDGDAAAAASTDASWECAVEPGHQPWPEGLKPLKEGDPQYLVVGPGERLDAALYDWAAEAMPEPGAPGGRYAPAVVSAIASPRSIAEAPGYALTPDGRLLVPDELPPMEYRPVPAGRVVKAEGASAGAFPEGGPAVVPPRTKASFLVDRRELVTAYPELAFSGGRGSRIVIGYQEALLEPGKPWKKGHRDEFEGKRFAGYQDEVLPDGGPGRSFHPLWWRTWRYMKIDVETKDESLSLDRLAVHFTAYPFEERARFDAARRDARPPLGGGMADGARVRPRDVRGLPLLRAAPVRRRHPDPGPHLLHGGRGRPARAAGHRQLRPLAPLRGDHLQPLPERPSAVHPALLPPVGGDGPRLLDVAGRPRLRAPAARGHAHRPRLVHGAAAP